MRQQALSGGEGKMIFSDNNGCKQITNFKVIQCANETKIVIASQPKEECDMEPQESCRTITKMVPHLRAREECVEVPQEVCGKSRAPIKKERPAIMNWCYKPDQKPTVLTPSSPVPAPPSSSHRKPWPGLT